MHKLMALVLALVLMLSGAALAGAADSQPGQASGPMGVTVGVTTKMSGNFFTNKWGVNSADVDLRELIHGNNTISWEETGVYAVNATVVSSMNSSESGGDKTYTITLNKDLRYSDGTPIDAYDYAFSALLLSSSEFAALGGSPTGLDYLKGYEAFRAGGGATAFPGVRVIDEYTLELTIDGKFLPYYYEIVLLNLTPYPIGVLAPGCAVKDDGQGAYISGPFTEELLRKTVLDPAAGYLYHPSVAAGPYKLESFDLANQTARFVKNPYYAGNFEKVKPTLDEITVVYENPEAALADIASGKIDLVNKVSEGSVIAEGMAQVSAGAVKMESYLRTGMSFISFSCELGATRSVNVRKAIAHCIDVDAVNKEFTGGYGQPVYGYYGMGQWMAPSNLAALAAYKTPLDLAAARKLLQEDGWTLNESGGAYNEKAGGVRYRKGADGNLEKLELKWAQPKETAMSALLTTAMQANLKAVGAEVTIEQLPFEELLKHYYRQTERVYNMFSLATNFSLAFDPYYAFHTGAEYQGATNRTGLEDEELMNLALDMRRTAVGDDAGYVAKWLKFQERFNALEPMMPLFSNVYFDFYRTDLQNFNSNMYFSWATAIVYSYIGEPAADATGAPSGGDLPTLG